jgi:uncharacterized protein (DUF342 family)
MLVDYFSEYLVWSALDGDQYLTIDPETPWLDIDIDELEEDLLENGILNADMERIEAAISRHSGEPEIVGPEFRIFSSEKQLNMRYMVDPFKATMAVLEGMAEAGLRLDREEVTYLLRTKEIIHGVRWDNIEDWLQNPEYGKDVVIAECTPPTKGEDAVIEEVVEVDPDARPLQLENGTVDFRDIDSIRMITAGDLIARRTPPTPGRPGRDVFGKVILPTPGKEYNLPQGTNTRPNGDFTELYADKTGYLFREAKRIAVGEVFVVRGDVDFSVGNIQYTGATRFSGRCRW